MPVQLQHEVETGALTVTASGTLKTEDYEQLVPFVEKTLDKQGKLDMLLLLRDFHGWTAGALWEDLKFDVKHFRDIRRLAIVGDRRWQKGMAKFCKPFTTAEVRFFELPELEVARMWLADAKVVSS